LPPAVPDGRRAFFRRVSFSANFPLLEIIASAGRQRDGSRFRLCAKQATENSHIFDNMVGHACAELPPQGVENSALRPIDTIEKSLR